jgi:hypothetical protein
MKTHTDSSKKHTLRDYGTGRRMPIVQIGTTMNPTGIPQSTIAVAASRVSLLGGVLSFRPSCESIGQRQAVVYADPEVPVCVWRHGPAPRCTLTRSWVVGPWAIFAVGTGDDAEELERKLQEHWPVLARLLFQAGKQLEQSA